MTSQRISWIDIARGIGILLVLYGHGLDANSIRYLIYSFHMPLFFFLSGLVLKTEQSRSLLSLVKKNSKATLLPYFIFAFSSFLLWVVMFDKERMTGELFLRQLLGIFYGSGTMGLLTFNNVLWFLPCLFVVRTVFGVMRTYIKRKITLFFILVSLSIVGYLYSLNVAYLRLPFGIEIALTGIVFFGIGYLWQSLPLQKYIEKHFLLTFLSSAILCYLFATLNYQWYELQVDLRLLHLNNYFLTYLGAISGILAVVALSTKINKNSLLEYLGKNSLVLFGWHLVVFFYLARMLHIFLSEGTIEQLRNLYLAPLFTIATIAIILLLNHMLRRARASLHFLL